MLVGGLQYDAGNIYLASVEIFPPPISSGCSIPDLPGARYHHSLSLLSGGRLVVCGGTTSNCISWVAGNTTWTIFGTMRCEDEKRIRYNLFLLLHSNTRHYHTAWTPPSLPDSVVLLGHSSGAQETDAEIVPGKKESVIFALLCLFLV